MYRNENLRNGHQKLDTAQPFLEVERAWPRYDSTSVSTLFCEPKMKIAVLDVGVRVLVSLSSGFSSTFFWIPHLYVGDGNVTVGYRKKISWFWVQVQNTVVEGTDLA